MTGNSDDGGRRRPSAGDRRIRTALFLVLGGLLLFATFYRGRTVEKADQRLNAQIKEDLASFRPNPISVTPEQAAAAVTKLKPSVSIAATMAVAVADLSAPGALNCAVGYSITNDSAVDIGDLQFEVSYASPQAKGSSAETISVPAFSTQGITPISALRGRCEGVTGQVTIHRCRFANGVDCSQTTKIIDNGAIVLTRAP